MTPPGYTRPSREEIAAKFMMLFPDADGEMRPWRYVNSSDPDVDIVLAMLDAERDAALRDAEASMREMVEHWKGLRATYSEAASDTGDARYGAMRDEAANESQHWACAADRIAALREAR